MLAERSGAKGEVKSKGESETSKAKAAAFGAKPQRTPRTQR
jgi:hypothetical protein